ncbi:MAG: hypothetical protein IJC48_08250 [Clostridia bacterium]|nr:hypothetical protein [Clostridia bacterium]MBQ4157667.1 hypothetical protein [Clostridia bacterium]
MLENMDQADIIRHLDSYVADLPKDVRANEDEYQKRLTLCASCEYLLNAACRLCGCYVQARAAKKNQRCPIAKHPKWTEQIEKSDEIVITR